jgi:PAS domain S-box-containing protein
VGRMDRHRAKTSKRRSHPSGRAGARKSEQGVSVSGPAFPQRELPNPRGDPLHPFVALVKTFNEFLFELDADGKFLSIWTSNDALLRERRAEFLGRHALEILGEEIFHPFSRIFRRVIKQGICEDIEFPVDFPTGTRWFQARVSAVGRGAQKVHSVCLLARDITDRRLAEESLRQHQALLGHAEQVTGIGCWGYDVESRQRIWSNQLFRLYGFDPANGVPGEESMAAMLDPSDRARIIGILTAAVE